MAPKTGQRVFNDDVVAVQSLADDRAPPPRPPPAPEPRTRRLTTVSRSAKPRDVLPLPAGRSAGKKPRGDNRDANLSDYLTSLGRIPLLTAEDEVRLASTLREVETSCWLHLLAVPAVVDAVGESELGADSAELRAGLGRLTALARGDDGAALADEAADVAALLRELDDDRRVVEAAIAVVDDAVARGEVPASLAGLIKADRRRAVDVRNAFVRANLRLVVSVARRFHHHRMPLIDLIQEGNLGLIKSVHRFDHRKGFRFSTYAHWWIRQAIERAIMNKGTQVRLPVHVFDARRELARVTRDLTHALGREPSDEQIATALGCTLDRLYEIAAAVPREPTSLDEPIGDDEDRTLAESVAGDGPAPDEQVITLDEELRVKRLLQRLSPMEIDIITRRFGLVGDDDETLEEIGRSYRLSRERVRQIQVQGLKKIQDHVERHRRGPVVELLH
jgi:RNA polymerase primary sigma factor